MTIKDLKYLLKDYEDITIFNIDTNKRKPITEYKQEGKKINVVKVAYLLGEAVVLCK